MLRPAVVVSLVCLGTLGAIGIASAIGVASVAEQDEADDARSLVISNDGGELASIPLAGNTFAVSYRNSIYGTVAEERYIVLPDGRYLLTQIAADQLAVLEEYYAVPGAPARAAESDRRAWVVSPDPAHPAEFETLSLAATDLGQRTLHTPGSAPLELWRLVEDSNPFIVLEIKETP